MVQWLGLHASTARGLGSIPGQATKIPQIMWLGQINKLKKKKVLNKLIKKIIMTDTFGVHQGRPNDISSSLQS